MSRALTAAWRSWAWAPATAWGGGVAVILGLLWLADSGRTAGGLIAAASNGLAVFFVVGGAGAVADARDGAEDERWAVEHPWRFALVPAALALVTLLALRLLALALDLEGPWRGLGDSALDSGIRAVVVFAIVGVLARRG